MAKTLRAAFLATILAGLIIPALIALRYAAVGQLSSYFTDHLANLLGTNMYLLRAAVGVAMVPFLYGLKLVFALNPSKRKLGGSIMTACVVFYNIGLYQATRGNFFTFDGEPIRWYALTPEGVKLFDRRGVDPVYGIVLRPVTPENAGTLKVLASGDFRTVDPARATWFNPMTGDAQVWYYQAPDTTLEFYNKPGHHPFTNEPLQPVTEDVYFQWQRQTRPAPALPIAAPPTLPAMHDPAPHDTQGRPQKSDITTTTVAKLHAGEDRMAAFKALINPVTLTAGKPNIAIFITAPSLSSGFAPDQALYAHLRSDKAHLITDLFRHGFLAEGYFGQLYDGNKELLQVTTNASHVDVLILGRLNYAFRKGAQIDSDLISCDITMTGKVINAAGDVVREDSIQVVGPGFTESAAIERGIELLSDQFTQRILKPIL